MVFFLNDILGEVTVRGLKVKNKSLFLPDSSLNNSREVINESCKENGNTCGDGIKVNLRKNRTLDGVVMDREPVFVKVDKECFIEMALDPQGIEDLQRFQINSLHFGSAKRPRPEVCARVAKMFRTRTVPPNVINWYGYVDLSLYWDTWLPEEGPFDDFLQKQ
ncbi:hypothetical protein Tco_0483529 [Tanacetum coccineum]